VRSLRGGRCGSFRRSKSAVVLRLLHHRVLSMIIITIPTYHSAARSSCLAIGASWGQLSGSPEVTVQIRKSTSPRPAVILRQITSAVTTLPRSCPYALDDSACRWADGEFGLRSFARPATAMEIRKIAGQGEDGRCAAGPEPALDRRRARCTLRLLCGSLRVVLPRARLLDSSDVPWSHVERLVGRDSIRQPSAETIVGIDSQRDA
jgi:hypothetical protein